MRVSRQPEFWLFVILLASYAFFWQSRDWNSASRLMLTYAIVDRGTIVLDGLESQTGDRAFFRGHAYSDKLPGFSLLAAGPYAAAKALFRLPSHPLGGPALTHGAADYWVSLLVSGVATALAAAILARLSRAVGVGSRGAVALGFCYGLATPAYAYATMSYGHQASALALLAAFALLWQRPQGKRRGVGEFAAGFLASGAAVVELQVGLVSAVLGMYLLAQVVGRVRPAGALGNFAVGAAIPAMVLLGYNQLAFGSPFDMGYFHHVTKQFAEVHSEENPLGLGTLKLDRALALLWGRHRGLLFHAPIVLLAPWGVVGLVRRGFPGMASVSVGAMLAVFLVNCSYPEWTGGWSTGPRLLVPLLPFAVLTVSGCLIPPNILARTLVGILGTAGALLMLLYVGVGARLPQDFTDPLFQVVLPLWRGEVIPGWPGPPFARNLVGLAVPEWVVALPAAARGLQFAPLALGQAVAIWLLLAWSGEEGRGRSDLRVDQEEKRGGEREDAEDPRAESKRVRPDV